MQCVTRLRVYASVSHVVEPRFPEPSYSGLIEVGRLRAEHLLRGSPFVIGNTDFLLRIPERVYAYMHEKQGLHGYP